jgi:mono/diheme cytochrome c family protein
MKIPSAATAAVITLACLAAASITVSLAGPATSAAAVQAAQDGSIARGRYLVAITGCNDCHTPGYQMTGGKAPEEKWLVGSPMGFQGPWGTSYPANLRLTVQSMTEAQWLVFARAERRPPMPWFSLTHMSDRDLTDMYRFIRSLGPTGEPAPAAVPPGGKVDTPYIVMEPQNLGGPHVTQAAPRKPEPRG